MEKGGKGGDDAHAPSSTSKRTAPRKINEMAASAAFMSDHVKPALSPTSLTTFSTSKTPPASCVINWRVMSFKRTHEIFDSVPTSERIHSGTSMLPAKRYFILS
jgi:hypothetical protein